MTITRWVKRVLGLALALGLCAGLWWLRPVPAAPEDLALLAGEQVALPGDSPDPAASPDPGAPAEAPADPAVPAPTEAPAETPAPALSIVETRKYIEMAPADASPTKAVLFLQGARVDPRAYARMLAPIAEAGYLVTIVKSPFDLAITDIGGLSENLNRHPGVTWWAIGGHSLGGVAASTFASSSPRLTPALFLWASYPYTDMSDVNDLSVLSVSGSNDTFTTADDVEASKAKLPKDAEFVEVEGANHSVFGDFGTLSGDGELTVPADAAQAQIVAATLQWLNTVSPLA